LSFAPLYIVPLSDQGSLKNIDFFSNIPPFLSTPHLVPLCRSRIEHNEFLFPLQFFCPFALPLLVPKSGGFQGDFSFKSDFGMTRTFFPPHFHFKLVTSEPFLWHSPSFLNPLNSRSTAGRCPGSLFFAQQWAASTPGFMTPQCFDQEVLVGKGNRCLLTTPPSPPFFFFSPPPFPAYQAGVRVRSPALFFDCLPDQTGRGLFWCFRPPAWEIFYNFLLRSCPDSSSVLLRSWLDQNGGCIGVSQICRIFFPRRPNLFPPFFLLFFCFVSWLFSGVQIFPPFFVSGSL